ncbi:hypothetical protein [Haloarcula litorea]|uniref:hypothetical protein n=1 Tax=Haloarcula litorea TaxID=3032579 RepID=UPI0023E76690|nr:hypothetical protein [Halomicroarcula sp. GDY20]
MGRRSVLAGVAVFVVVVAIATGPLVGVDATRKPVTQFGEGTATVEGVTTDTTAFRVTDGRFGTGVAYVRVPTATVRVSAVEDRPRLLYLVSVPALGVELTASTVVTTPGSYRLAPDDRGLARDAPDASSYSGRLTVRVQSFEADRTVYDRNLTVEVAA